ncbi:MAG: GHKL domain-containing protein [Micromonosporaceae bacterium]|nr:GHKL domain-containing protein [Micromonosporaceae bacterium]
MRRRLSRWLGERSLAQQLLLLQAAVVLAVCLIVATTVLLDTRRDLDAASAQRVLAVAETVARSPQVVDAVRAVSAVPGTARHHTDVQAYAESVRRSAGTDFVVVMTPKRVRLSHPNPDQIGRHFIGTIAPALAGEPFTETYTGTLGPSVRAVAPVRYGERVVGLVSVGITVAKIGQEFWAQLPAVFGVAGLAYVLAAAGAFAVSRRLRRQTHGLGPREITRMYEYWDAVLHSVREGLLVLDSDRRLQLANDEAVRLLELPPDAVGGPVGDAGLPDSLRDLAESGRDAVDELHLVGLRTLLVNQRPAVWEERRLGTVVSFRDHTELTALTGELDSVKSFAEALRAQTHEAANRLHTVVAMVELGRAEAAVRLATDELRLTQELTDRVTSAVAEPVLSALLLGKASQAHERGVELVVSDETEVGDTAVDPRDLVTVVGNLIDNAIDAALAGEPPRRVVVTVRECNGEFLARVADSGPGMAPARLPEVVRRDGSTKGDGRGLGLALVDQVVRRHGGSLTLEHDGGAVFEVRLPVARPAGAAARPAASEAAP